MRDHSCKRVHELLRQSGVSVTGSRDSTVDECAALVVSIAAQDGEPIAAGDVIKGILGVPNQLKHHSSESQAVVDANWCEEAREKIELAISTWFGVYQTMTQDMVRFDQSSKA